MPTISSTSATPVHSSHGYERPSGHPTEQTLAKGFLQQLPPWIRDLFASAAERDSRLKNNASLDADSIAGLAAGIVANNPKLETISVTANTSFFQAQYAIGSNVNPPQDVFIDIINCVDAALAQELMGEYLITFDDDISEVVKPTDHALGQVSLQTADSIFWVRNAVFVKLFTLPAVHDTTTTTITTTEDGKNVTQMLHELASALDAHLAASAVIAKIQKKPNAAVRAASYKCAWGETFKVLLTDAADAHELKVAEPADPSIVDLVENGTSQGEYTFIGILPGKTKVKLIVARADNLAVETTDIDVEVVKS